MGISKLAVAVRKSLDVSTIGYKQLAPRRLKDDFLDLRPALERIHEWAFKDQVNGYLYWFAVAELLKDASAMRERVARLESLLAAGSGEVGRPDSAH